MNPQDRTFLWLVGMLLAASVLHCGGARGCAEAIRAARCAPEGAP